MTFFNVANRPLTSPTCDKLLVTNIFRLEHLQQRPSDGSTSLSVSPCFLPRKQFYHVKDLILELYKLWISGRLVVLGLFIILTPQSGQRNIIIYINIILLYYIIYILWKGYTPDPSLLPFPASNILKIFSKKVKNVIFDLKLVISS